LLHRSSIGFDGQSCVERAICELSEAPLGHNGLFGKVVHLLLSVASCGRNRCWPVS